MDSRHGRSRDLDREALRELVIEYEERFAAFSRACSEGMAVHEGGVILVANPTCAAMFADQGRDLVGVPIQDLVEPGADGAVPDLARGEIADRIAINCRRCDGTTFPARARTVSASFHGRPVRVTVFEDISELEQARTERARLDGKIRQTQRLESLGVLAGGIAHDFNNLLIGILSNAGLALRRLDPDAPARPLIERVEIAGRRAAELTTQLLAYSGKGRLRVEVIDLSGLVDEMTQLLNTVVSKKATLAYSFGRDLPAIEGDPGQIRQVVMNLITNASDALRGGQGSITVRTGEIDVGRISQADTLPHGELGDGPHIFVEVSDTGCGMDEATQRRMFDPFFTTRNKGRGLGLAAALGIVRGHHGAIQVHSELGHGTTVKVILPARERPHGVKAAPERDIEGWRSEGLALVVDDHPMVRQAAEAILEDAGFCVVSAGDGAEALERFRERPDEFRLVLLDLTMPRLSGVETFHAMRQLRPDVKVVLSSGFDQQNATERLSEGEGLAGFVQKPYTPIQLLRVVRGVLEG